MAKLLRISDHLTGEIKAPKGTSVANRVRYYKLLRKIAYAAREMRQKWNVNSGVRTYAEQVVLYERYLNGTGALAAVPGTSNHERGLAADVSVRTRKGLVPVGKSPRRRAALAKRGLGFPVKGESWHVESV